jgi:uncharacterized protein (DUF427 family)
VTGGYPPALPPVNHTAPVPRRIRATLAGRTVLDTMSALYVWEWPHYPQYYIPLADIDPAVLVDKQHEQKLSRGTARRYALQAGETVRPAALRVYGCDVRCFRPAAGSIRAHTTADSFATSIPAATL